MTPDERKAEIVAWLHSEARDLDDPFNSTIAFIEEQADRLVAAEAELEHREIMVDRLEAELAAAEAEVERLRSFIEMQRRVGLRLEAQRERLAAADALATAVERWFGKSKDDDDPRRGLLDALDAYRFPLTRRSQP